MGGIVIQKRSDGTSSMTDRVRPVDEIPEVLVGSFLALVYFYLSLPGNGCSG